MNYAGKERKFTNCSSFKAGKWVGSLLGALGWGLLRHGTPVPGNVLVWAVSRSRGGTSVAPRCWFIFSLPSVWPRALGFSARLVCVEIPPVAHPAERGDQLARWFPPVIPRWQMMGEIPKAPKAEALGSGGCLCLLHLALQTPTLGLPVQRDGGTPPGRGVGVMGR